MGATSFESVFSFLNQGWVGSVIGLTGILIGAVLSILFFVRSRRKASPMVQLSRMTIISSRADVIPDTVEILYNGNKVSQLSKTNVILWNNGTETLFGSSIVEDDPIVVRFYEETIILRYQVLKETRDVNKARVQLYDGSSSAVKVEFDFLDPKDGLNIELLHSSNRDPAVTGTIRGIPSGVKILNSYPSVLFPFPFIKNLAMLGRSKYGFVLLMLFGLVSSIIGILGQFNIFVIDSLRERHADNTVLFVLGILYTLLPGFMLWAQRRRYPKALDIS